MMINRQKQRQAILALAATAAVLALAGCGGGGGDGGSSNAAGNNGGLGGTSIPASAVQSSDSFIAYVKQVVSEKLDASESIDLGNAVGPASNTTEPVGL